MSQNTKTNGSAANNATSTDDPTSAERREHETVDQQTRERVIARDGACRGCGRDEATNGGQVSLEVHHIERDPDGMAEHDMANLTTLCQSCHSWIHQQPTTEELPVEVPEAAAEQLQARDREILQVLDEIGPSMVSDIADALTVDLTVVAVRERLWTIMGLDNQVEWCDDQIVDQDVVSGEWGLTGQIANSSRGRIPEDTQALLQRAVDERVRQALDRGLDRDTIADVFGIHSRTTWLKEKRARAYDFPLDAVADARGRPSSDGAESEESDDASTAGENEAEDEDDEHQERLTSLAGVDNEDSSREASDKQSRTDGSATSASAVVADDNESIREALQQALNALKGVEDSLQGA